MKRRDFLASATASCITLSGVEQTVKFVSWGFSGPDGYKLCGMYVHDGEHLSLNNLPATCKSVFVYPGGSVSFRSPWLSFTNITPVDTPIRFDMADLLEPPKDGTIVLGHLIT